jgi:amylosucrase
VLNPSRTAKQQAFNLLHSLYGEQPNFRAWFNAFSAAVSKLALAREPALKTLDLARAADPTWFQSQTMLGYCAYTDRFAGTLNGVKARIPHLKSLGVTYLHLLPFFKARSGGPDNNDGGFAIADYESIAPHLGHIDDLAPLTQALRAEGISLCADFVLNHVADEHVWAKAAKAGDPHYQAFFHTFTDAAEAAAHEQTLGQVFPETAPGNFTWSEPMQRWVWTTFYPFQWDLNYHNPAVFAEIALALLRLANHGVEVFRLDSAPFLWKQLGTSCMNLPQAHTVLAALRAVVSWAAPAVVLKSEAIVPAAQAAAYLGTDTTQECQLAYHGALMAASWASLVEQNASLVKAVIADTAKAPPNTSWLTYVRCHDDIVWSTLKPQVAASGQDYQARIGQVSRFLAGQVQGAYAEGVPFQTAGNPNAVHGTNGMCANLVGLHNLKHNQTHAILRFCLLHALALAHGGLPVIYMGDEFAQANDPAGRDALDSRWVHRPMWDEALLAESKLEINLVGVMFRALQLACRDRANNPDFHAAASLRLLDVQSEVLAFMRNEGTLCVFNFSETTQKITLPEGQTFTSMRSGKQHRDTIELQLHGFEWLKVVT